MTTHTTQTTELPKQISDEFDEKFDLVGIDDHTCEGWNDLGDDEAHWMKAYLDDQTRGDLKLWFAETLETEVQKAVEAERDSEKLILDAIYEAVNGSDQRFMEEQGIHLDNRYEHLGAMKIIKHLLESLSQKEKS